MWSFLLVHTLRCVNSCWSYCFSDLAMFRCFGSRFIWPTICKIRQFSLGIWHCICHCFVNEAMKCTCQQRSSACMAVRMSCVHVHVQLRRHLYCLHQCILFCSKLMRWPMHLSSLHPPNSGLARAYALILLADEVSILPNLCTEVVLQCTY